MAIKTEDVGLKSIKFIDAEWRRRTGAKGPARTYRDRSDLSKHVFDGHGNETISNKKRTIAKGVTQEGKQLKTDLRQNVKHAYRDKTEKERSNLISDLIGAIKKTGGHINLVHNDESNFGWMNDSDTKNLCEVGKILANYGDFGDEQSV